MTTVEFSIVGGLLLLIVLGVIEFGRLLFTLDVLQETARRGARVAAVCQVGNAGVTSAALFANLPRLSSTNIDVAYLDVNGDETSVYDAIRYVRVSVIDYEFQLFLPGIDRGLPLPAFTSTLPRESLGVPKYGAPAACYEGP